MFWSALQLKFHHTECKTLHQWTTGLTSVLPWATCLNINLVHSHKRDITVYQCRLIQHILSITVKCSHRLCANYFYYAAAFVHPSTISNEGSHNTLYYYPHYFLLTGNCNSISWLYFWCTIVLTIPNHALVQICRKLHPYFSQGPSPKFITL